MSVEETASLALLGLSAFYFLIAFMCVVARRRGATMFEGLKARDANYDPKWFFSERYFYRELKTKSNLSLSQKLSQHVFLIPVFATLAGIVPFIVAFSFIFALPRAGYALVIPIFGAVLLVEGLDALEGFLYIRNASRFYPSKMDRRDLPYLAQALGDLRNGIRYFSILGLMSVFTAAYIGFLVNLLIEYLSRYLGIFFGAGEILARVSPAFTIILFFVPIPLVWISSRLVLDLLRKIFSSRSRTAD